MDCKLCHTCVNPTKSDTCLIYCPRPIGSEKKDVIPIGRTPDHVILKFLSSQKQEPTWGPVDFPHKLHARMSDFKEGCTTCHHNSPTDKFHPTCKECHDPNVKQEQIKKPGLQGAYHRQCLNCHINWSKDTECKVCHRYDPHQMKFAQFTSPNPRIKICKEPEKIVFDTNYKQNRFVTFFHNDHTDQFRLDCKNCHQNQPCISCHYQNERTVPLGAVSREMAESKCVHCHDTNQKENCERCHRQKPLEERFNHDKETRWALGIYHSSASCNKCHKPNQVKKKTASSCMACHQDWNAENFDHDVAGIKLNEDHADLECHDCHLNKQYEQKPSCVECHDNDLTYPDHKPGIPTRKGKPGVRTG